MTEKGTTPLQRWRPMQNLTRKIFKENTKLSKADHLPETSVFSFLFPTLFMMHQLKFHKVWQEKWSAWVKVIKMDNIYFGEKNVWSMHPIDSPNKGPVCRIWWLTFMVGDIDWEAHIKSILLKMTQQSWKKMQTWKMSIFVREQILENSFGQLF